MAANDPLSDLEREEYSSQGEAMRMLALAVGEINEEIDQRSSVRGERVEEKVDRLFKAVKRIAEKFDAKSFTVSVGLPVGVSVSIEWPVGD
jgi:hypothetical protein